MVVRDYAADVTGWMDLDYEIGNEKKEADYRDALYLEVELIYWKKAPPINKLIIINLLINKD